MNKILALIFFPVILLAGEIKQTTTESYIIHPEKESGYFQGWNLYFFNNDYFITVNLIVSNIGPGSMNNGVNIIVFEKNTPPLFIEKEFSGSNLKYSTNEFYLQLYNNTLIKKGNKFILNVDIKNTHLYLEFDPYNNGAEISGGKTPIGPNRFLKADIPFSNAKSYGVIVRNGVKKVIYGNGNMEHMITNQEVYKFSSSWFIMKTFTEDGFSIVAGGFNGNKNYPEKFFKTVAVISPTGKFLFTGKSVQNEILRSDLDKNISYRLTLAERLYFDNEKKCYLEITEIRPFSKINVLANISILLRKIIQVFFASPYQIYSTVKSEFRCNEKVYLGKGFHSYFLINPD